jgi:hypothetical protein
MGGGIGVRQGVAMDSLNFYLGPPYPTLLCPAGGLRPYSPLLDTPRHMPMVGVGADQPLGLGAGGDG